MSCRRVLTRSLVNWTRLAPRECLVRRKPWQNARTPLFPKLCSSPASVPEFSLSCLGIQSFRRCIRAHWICALSRGLHSADSGRLLSGRYLIHVVLPHAVFFGYPRWRCRTVHRDQSDPRSTRPRCVCTRHAAHVESYAGYGGGDPAIVPRFGSTSEQNSITSRCFSVPDFLCCKSARNVASETTRAGLTLRLEIFTCASADSGQDSCAPGAGLTDPDLEAHG